MGTVTKVAAALAFGAPYCRQVSLAAAPLLLLTLANGCRGAEGCLDCRQRFKNLKSRFARLCAQYRDRYSQPTCSKYPWRRKSFQGFALDELSLDLILEKTHRVLRLIEINQSLAELPKFWNWLHEVKMPEQSRDVLCPPSCRGTVSVFNCSTCRKGDMPCWDMKACYPEQTKLQSVALLLCSISGSCLLLGFISCALEFWLRQEVAIE